MQTLLGKLTALGKNATAAKTDGEYAKCVNCIVEGIKPTSSYAGLSQYSKVDVLELGKESGTYLLH